MGAETAVDSERPLTGRQLGYGRPPGGVNKTTKAVKDAIFEAFDRAGGVEYLLRVAEEDPRTFCALVAKLIPTELKADVTIREGFADLLERARARACLPSPPTPN